MEGFRDVCPSFFENGSLQQRNGTYVEEGGHVSSSLEGWKEVGSMRASG